MTFLPEFDFILGGVPRFAAESAWSSRLVDRWARLLPFRAFHDLRGGRPTVSAARGQAPLVLVQADPEAYLLPEAAFRLLVKLGEPRRDLVFPVSNEPWTEEARCAVPFSYHTPSLLEEAVRFVAAADPASPPRPSASPRCEKRRGVCARRASSGSSASSRTRMTRRKPRACATGSSRGRSKRSPRSSPASSTRSSSGMSSSTSRTLRPRSTACGHGCRRG